MAEWKVELDDVKYSSGEFHLRDINLRIKPGIVTGIVGKNGSGKSTLLRLIHGDLKPESGHVIVDGEPVKGLNSVKLARKMSFLQQEIYDPLNFTVRDVMSVSAYTRGIDSDEMCLMALEELGIGSLFNHNFSMLSGGERRLVTIAASLYQDAEIMILDEPTTYLDIDNQHAVHRLLKKLKENGKTIIMVMHELNAINSLSDEVILLRSGSVVASGPVRDTMTVENLRKTFSVTFQELSTPTGNIFYSFP